MIGSAAECFTLGGLGAGGTLGLLTFYPVLCSAPSLQTKADHADNAEVEITRCSRGQYFGELALVTNKPRAASAYAVGDVKCLGKTKHTRTHVNTNELQR